MTENKEKGSKYQRAIYAILQDHPIAFSPRLSQVLGSINASILMAQLLYWRGKGAHGNWVYKTIDEMREETGMSRSEQDTAIRKCKEKELITMMRKGIPAKRYFLVEIEKLIDLVDKWAQNNPQVLRIDPRSIAGLKQSITDTTQDTTHNISSVKRKVRIKINQDLSEKRRMLVESKNMRK